MRSRLGLSILVLALTPLPSAGALHPRISLSLSVPPLRAGPRAACIACAEQELPSDDYNPPMSPMDELVRREVELAFTGDETRLLDADEDQRRALIESRVADVTRSVLAKLGFDAEEMQLELEERVAELSRQRAADGAAKVDASVSEVRERLSDSRDRISDEQARISQLRKDAATIDASVPPSQLALLAAGLALLVAAAISFSVVVT